MERAPTPSRPSLPETVVVCECWARDGLQAMPTLVPTARKIEMIDGFTDGGFR